MTTAETIIEFLKWVLSEGVGHGFWHFIGWLMILAHLCKIPRLINLDFSRKIEKKIDEAAK